MPTPVDSDDSDELMIFPLTDIDGCSDANLTNDDDSFDNQNTWRGSHFMPVMTLKGRRRSLLGTTGSFSRLQRLDSVPTLRSIKTFSERREDGSCRQELDIRMLPPRDRWLWAIKNLHRLKDPWEKFHLEELKVEKAIRHRYNAIKKCWVKDVVRVKIEKEPFNHGAMRACYRLKKLDRVREGDADWKKQGRNFVAKEYMEGVERGVYFEDVRLQMDAKLWGEEYNRHRPPKKVDILQMAVIEFTDRPNSPLFHLEHFVDGIYTKYNSNSGFVEESLRLTPQAFSHFTFERSSHRLIVVDIQGVGDLWTDPQVHTAEGTGYGDGNLGVRGMALFFHSHVCNPICESLQLSKFDLCDSEIKQQGTFIKTYKNSVTRLRGEEEVCYSASPRECTDFTLLFTRGLSTTSEVFSDDSSQNDTSMDSRGCGDDNDDDEDDDEPMSFSMSPLSPPIRCHSKFLADSDESGSASITEEEERKRFQQALRAGARPSCFARESDLRRLQLNKRSGDSILGQIHHELAVYHEIGRFCQSPDEQYDIKAALYHEQLASELGVMCAILTLAHIYLGLPHDVLSSVSIEDSTENIDRGIELMISASEAGDRGAMLYMARAFQTGQGLGTKRERSYKQAVDWYNRAAQMTEVDDSGTYDATMDHPLYQIKATMAELYLAGGFDLDKDPSYAGDLFTEAAECATAAMKGKLASKYYALAEEAWGQVEE